MFDCFFQYKRKRTILRYSLFIVMIVCFQSFYSCNRYIPEPNQAPKDSVGNTKENVLDILYTLADKYDMKVISDVSLASVQSKFSGNYTTSVADSIIERINAYVDDYQNRYGKHKSFWGWYLDYEVNPMKPTDAAKLTFWRKIWKEVTDECHKVQPDSKVTIAPFFIIDSTHYPTLWMPVSVWGNVWEKTLEETGIDILMLQESGVAHASFVTLSDREPFYKAMADACAQSGTQFWADMESAQIQANDWNDLVRIRNNDEQDEYYDFTPIDWLSQKLDLAAKYCTNIVNWGYFPYMNPVINTGSGAPWIVRNDRDSKAAYDAYKNYYAGISQSIPEGKKSRLVMSGTLWWISTGYSSWSKDQMKQVLEEQIKRQKEIGFNILWLVNTANNIMAF